jgi:hypothetical protein
MAKIFRSIFTICICCFVLSGCGSTQYTDLAADPDFEINIPERYFASDEKTPADIKLICSALLNKLRHRGETPFVRFDSIAGENVQKEEFKYEGFDVTHIDITGIEVKESAKNKTQGTLEGLFHFKDFVGRGASTFFVADYIKTSNGITITKAGTDNVPSSFPRVQAFFVPIQAISKIKGTTLNGYWEMYAFALENAVNMTPTPKEIQAYQSYQELSSGQKMTADKDMELEKYAVMVFCLDRLSEPERFEVVVPTSSVKPGYRDDNGWPMAVIPAEFVVDSLGKTFDILALYNPIGKSEKILIGKFINQKAYSSSIR